MSYVVRISGRTVARAVVASVLAATTVSAAQAQSAQKYAFQIAALATSINVGSGGSSTSGIGIEPQLRFNRLYSSEKGAVSLGIGGQYTSHKSGSDELNISGVFLEPRFVPVTGSTRLFPYIAGRLALLNQSNNFGTSSGGLAFGGGAGLVVKLSKVINIDAGAALVRQSFSDFKFDDGSTGTFRAFTTYAAKIGVNVGFPK